MSNKWALEIRGIKKSYEMKRYLHFNLAWSTYLLHANSVAEEVVWMRSNPLFSEILILTQIPSVFSIFKYWRLPKGLKSKRLWRSVSHGNWIVNSNLEVWRPLFKRIDPYYFYQWYQSFTNQLLEKFSLNVMTLKGPSKDIFLKRVECATTCLFEVFRS